MCLLLIFVLLNIWRHCWGGWIGGVDGDMAFKISPTGHPASASLCSIVDASWPSWHRFVVDGLVDTSLPLHLVCFPTHHLPTHPLSCTLSFLWDLFSCQFFKVSFLFSYLSRFLFIRLQQVCDREQLRVFFGKFVQLTDNFCWQNYVYCCCILCHCCWFSCCVGCFCYVPSCWKWLAQVLNVLLYPHKTADAQEGLLAFL